MHICLSMCVRAGVCMHVCACVPKERRVVCVGCERKKVWLFQGGLILPLPASTDLWACEGNLSFVTFHLFSPLRLFFFSHSLSLNGIQLFSESFMCCAASTKEQRTARRTEQGRKGREERSRETARRELVSFCIWLKPC